MIRTLTLDNYRGFRRFELHDLGRVNLIVGTNNSGKTSILEAVEALAGAGDVTPTLRALRRRGEESTDHAPTSRRRYFDVRHLFFGHEVVPGTQFQILGATDDATWTHVGVVAERGRTEPGEREQGSDTRTATAVALRLRLEWPGRAAPGLKFRLTPDGAVPRPPTSDFEKYDQFKHPNVRLVTTLGLRPELVVAMFEGVVLTPEEDTVIKTLNIIEPSVERIAPGRARGSGTTKGGLLLRRRGDPGRVPIGSMGDGIWRLLGLALSLVHCRDGILLVDEIDTGLHYSVMEKMWRLVTETARRLNVQVFATTHSRDCYESLAAVCRDGVMDGSEVTIQRIEPKKGRSVAYSEAAIVAAARRDTEVR